VEDWVGTTRSEAVGWAVAVLRLAVTFFFVFPAAGLVAAVDFGLGFLRPAVFLGGGYFRLRGRLRNRLRRGFKIWWWYGGGLDNTPPSVDVIPSLAQIRLLGFKSSGVDRSGALSHTLWRSLCKGRLRLFRLDTGTVTRCVVAPAATALMLLPPG